MDEKVSIIMPSYNHAKFLDESIKSVLNQNYNNWELIIVDDGSTDDSSKIIEKYRNEHKEKIKFFTHPQNTNKGISQTYKLGLEKAIGDYIAFLESDDIFFEDSISIKIEMLKKFQNAALIFSDFENFGEPQFLLKYANLLTKKHKKATEQLSKKPFSGLHILKHNFIPSFSCVLVRKEAFDHVLFCLPKEYDHLFDWWLWMQIGLSNNFLYLPQNKTKKRAHKTGAALLYHTCKNQEETIFELRKTLLKKIINNLKINGSKKIYKKYLENAYSFFIEENSKNQTQFPINKNIEIKLLKITSILLPFYIIRYILKYIINNLKEYQIKKNKNIFINRLENYLNNEKKQNK